MNAKLSIADAVVFLVAFLGPVTAVGLGWKRQARELAAILADCRKCSAVREARDYAMNRQAERNAVYECEDCGYTATEAELDALRRMRDKDSDRGRVEG